MTTRELCIYKFNELLTGLNKSVENIFNLLFEFFRKYPILIDVPSDNIGH